MSKSVSGISEGEVDEMVQGGGDIEAGGDTEAGVELGEVLWHLLERRR